MDLRDHDVRILAISHCDSSATFSAEPGRCDLRMWRHLVGLTPAAPGFAEVSLTPRIHDLFGPRSVVGEFLSPRGRIFSSWKLDSAAGTVSLQVRLPVGVGAATITVPKPTTIGKPSAAAVVKLHGSVVWDGAKLVGRPAGIVSAVDTPDGVSFSTTNGAFSFESKAAMSTFHRFKADDDAATPLAPAPACALTGNWTDANSQPHSHTHIEFWQDPGGGFVARTTPWNNMGLSSHGRFVTPNTVELLMVGGQMESSAVTASPQVNGAVTDVLIEGNQMENTQPWNNFTIRQAKAANGSGVDRTARIFLRNNQGMECGMALDDGRRGPCHTPHTSSLPLKSDGVAPTDKKRRLVGVIQTTPSVAFAAAHPENITAMPFDGVMLIADPPVPWIPSRFYPSEHSADFSFATMSNRSMNLTALTEQLGQLNGVNLGGVTENFLLVHANGASAFSSFDGVVSGNFKKLAAAAAATDGLRGIIFDSECYLRDPTNKLAVCWMPSRVCPKSCPTPKLQWPWLRRCMLGRVPCRGIQGWRGGYDKRARGMAGGPDAVDDWSVGLNESNPSASSFHQ